MRPQFRQIILRILLIGFLISPGIVRAQDAPSTPSSGSGPAISIRPHDQSDGSRFETELEPGESHEFTVVIGNFGNEPIELRTYVADIVPSLNGGLLLVDSTAERTGITLWFEYPTEEFTLEPGEEIERSMVVAVPEGTDPGQYVSAVALETVNPVQELGSFNQYFRRVVSVYTVVPGDLYTEFSFGEPRIDYDKNRPFIVIPVVNSGRMRIDLMGTFTLRNSQGEQISEGTSQLAPIYMGQETEIYVALASPPPPGEYTVSFEFEDSLSGISIGSNDVALTAPEPAAAVDVSPITFENVEVLANDDPIIFANVSVDVLSRQASQSSTRLTLSVYHNGEHVEDFVLAENLRLEAGTPTTVSQRYLPATNWESGTYTFSLKLESTGGGTTDLLLEEANVATLEVP